MNILVTGGAGYIGSVLVPYLVSEGHCVRVVDKLMYGGEGLLSVIDNIDLHCNTDIGVDCVNLEGVDVIIHLAAIVGESACDIWGEDRTRITNYLGTRDLVTNAKEANVSRLLFASTCSNYGIAEELAIEDSELNPLGLYAQTKVSAEHEVLSAGYTVLRFATVFGLSPRMRFDTIVNQFARDAALCRPFEVYGPGAKRPVIHVKDVVRAIGLFIDIDYPHQIYNVGGFNLTKLDLVKMLAIYNPDWEVKLHFGKGGRDYAVDFRRIHDDTGFECHIPVEASIDKMYRMVKNGMFVDPCDEKWTNA